jgi:hypothetical protein
MLTMPEDRAAVLITDAARPYDEEHAARKRRYMTTMLFRLGMLVLAGILYEVWWLALGLVLLSIPLPWIAVLTANDRPPLRTENAHRYERSAVTIEARDHPVIEG